MLKVLNLAMAPAELGPVNVRLGLLAGGLDMKIDVVRADTLRTLQGRRDALGDALQLAGYAVEAITLRLLDVAASDAVAINAAAEQKGTNNPASGGAGSGDGGTMRRRPEDGASQSPRGSPAGARVAGAVAVDAAAVRGLYL